MITKPQTWKHGSTTGYKAHSCRCAPCRAAMSAYTFDRIALSSPAKGAALVSWWIGVPREQLTAAAARERPRMKLSKFGAGISKSYDAGTN